MKTILLLAFLCLFCFSATACGNGAEAAVDEYVTAMDAQTKKLEAGNYDSTDFNTQLKPVFEKLIEETVKMEDKKLPSELKTKSDEAAKRFSDAASKAMESSDEKTKKQGEEAVAAYASLTMEVAFAKAMNK